MRAQKSQSQHHAESGDVAAGAGGWVSVSFVIAGLQRVLRRKPKAAALWNPGEPLYLSRARGLLHALLCAAVFAAVHTYVFV